MFFIKLRVLVNPISPISCLSLRIYEMDGTGTALNRPRLMSWFVAIIQINGHSLHATCHSASHYRLRSNLAGAYRYNRGIPASEICARWTFIELRRQDSPGGSKGDHDKNRMWIPEENERLIEGGKKREDDGRNRTGWNLFPVHCFLWAYVGYMITP